MLKQITSLIFILASVPVILTNCSQTNDGNIEDSLKDAYSENFEIGAAISVSQLIDEDTADLQVVKKHFNALVAENCMKAEIIQPEKSKFDFMASDSLVAFAERNNLKIHGHTLIWHSQLPPWFFVDESGDEVHRAELIARMKNHIYTIVGRYKGRIQSWDVVNEAFLDDGKLRQSKFLSIIGEDYIKLAFQFASEADPEADLYYNDYAMARPGKRDAVVNLVKNLQAEGIKIDGIGMQGHMDLYSPSINEMEESIKAYSSLDVEVMITELDITVLPYPWDNVGANVEVSYEYREEIDPYINGLTDSTKVLFENRYLDLFSLFLQYSESISRVTFWGVNDAQSWRNNWPVNGRTDYPLIIDRNNKEKDVVYKLIQLADSLNNKESKELN